MISNLMNANWYQASFAAFEGLHEFELLSARLQKELQRPQRTLPACCLGAGCGRSLKNRLGRQAHELKYRLPRMGQARMHAMSDAHSGATWSSG